MADLAGIPRPEGEEARALGRAIAKFLRETITDDKATERLALAILADWLDEPDARPTMTKYDLSAKTGMGKRNVERGLPGVEDRLLVRVVGDHARHGEDRFALLIEEGANPPRAGPETKEMPAPLEPAHIVGNGVVSTLPAEPADETVAEPSAPAKNQNNL